jgi:hypothetical protein
MMKLHILLTGVFGAGVSTTVPAAVVEVQLRDSFWLGLAGRQGDPDLGAVDHLSSMRFPSIPDEMAWMESGHSGLSILVN